LKVGNDLFDTGQISTILERFEQSTAGQTIDSEVVKSTLLPVNLVSYHGESLESLQSSFEEAIDDYLEMCKEEGLEPNITSIEELQKTINNNAEKFINNYAAI